MAPIAYPAVRLHRLPGDRSMAIIELESIEWVKGCRDSEEYPGVTTLRQPAGPIWLLVAPGW